MSRNVRYFDEFRVGESYTTVSRTVTEADVMAFAGLTMDYNPLHTDFEFAKQTPYGRPIAHGLLGLALANGLKQRLGLLDGSVLAFLGIKDWNFHRPIFFGDTIHVQLTITETRPSKSQSDRGIITQRVEVLNQAGTMVQSGHLTTMLRVRPRAGEAKS